MTAALTVVPTPIGNLGDITERSRRALADATVIACEDTRVTRRLLHHLGIVAPRLVVVNDHTERDAIAAVCAAIDAGERVVLVSDAGTPAVSDPGWRVARAVIDVGGEIDVLPGASAAIVKDALSTATLLDEVTINVGAPGGGGAQGGTINPGPAGLGGLACTTLTLGAADTCDPAL